VYNGVRKGENNMHKKLICLSLALMMLMSGAVFAEAPSIIVSDTYSVSGNNDQLFITIVEMTQAARDKLKDIGAFIADGGSLIDFFGEDVREAVAELLPPGFDLTTLVMNELISIEFTVYDWDADEIVKYFTFPTEYEDGIAIVALIGIVLEDGEVVWVALETEVENGLVKVYFTYEALRLMEDGSEVMLAILSQDTN